MHETCCPQYTIRLDVSKFKPSKAQRHVLNRVRRYLEGDQGGRGKATPTGSAGNTNGHGSQGDNSVTTLNGRSHPNRDGVIDDGDNAVPGPNGSDTDPNNGGNGPEVGGKLEALTGITAKAVTEAVAGAPALSGMNLAPGWESNLVKWAQVRSYTSRDSRIVCYFWRKSRLCLITLLNFRQHGLIRRPYISLDRDLHERVVALCPVN